MHTFYRYPEDPEISNHRNTSALYEVGLFGRIGAVLVAVESDSPGLEHDLDEILAVLAINRQLETHVSSADLDAAYYTDEGWVDRADVERAELVKTWEAYAFTFCDDCVIAITNGDYTGIHGESRVEAVRKGVDNLMRGSVWLGERDEFSTWRCDCCRTRLAGARTDAVITRFGGAE